MAMRQFWLTAEVEGKQTPIGTGPRSRGGSMNVDLAAKIDGDSRRVVGVTCRASSYPLKESDTTLRIRTTIRAGRATELTYLWRYADAQRDVPVGEVIAKLFTDMDTGTDVSALEDGMKKAVEELRKTAELRGLDWEALVRGGRQ